MAEEELLSPSMVSHPSSTATMSSSLLFPFQWSRWRDGGDVIDQRMVWVVVAIIGTILLKPMRSLINKYRLHQRQKKYPQIVKLEPKTKLTRHHHKKSLATKFKTWATKFKNRYLTLENLRAVFEQWVLAPLQLLLSACLFVLIMPVTCLLRFVGKSLRQILTLGFRAIQSSWKFMYSFVAARLAPPKETIPGVLRKPKAQRQNKNNYNKQMRNNVQFNEHSTGQVRTQHYYYNPLAKPGEPVQPHSSRTPPRGNNNNGEVTTPAENFIDDPEEIGRRLTERQNMNKIKQRIQTPPPKARQKILAPPTAGKENAAHQNGFANNTEMQATTTKVNPKRPIQRQAAFSETSPPAAAGAYAASSPAGTFPSTTTRQATPLNNSTTRANNKKVTPRPFILSSPQQPLSSQLRKRRMAGETLFSHTPQETSKSLEVSGQPNQAKRRRIMVRATLPNAQRRVTLLPPGRRINNKREREEQILQEFNRKREKPTSDDANNKTATSAAATTLPPVNFGAATQGDQTAAPAVTPKPFVFGADKQVPPPGETNPASAATAKPFIFGGDNKDLTSGTSSTFSFGGDNKDSTSGTTNLFKFGSTSASGGVPNSANSATPTPTQTQPGDDTKPGAFTTNAATEDTKPPAFATSSTGTPSVFQFGPNGNGTGATPAPTPNTTAFQSGANNTDTGATPAPATSAFQFGANESGTGTTPAPSAGAPNFQYGSDNASGTPAPPDDKKLFHFGATNAGSTSFGATNAGSTPAPADEEQPFYFGATNASSTPAPADDKQKQPFQIGANAGTTPAPAPDAPNGFGNTFATTPAAPATAFAFGSTQPAAKPDPPTGNASDSGPQPSFAFGSTVENTPQPGTATSNVGFGSIPSSFTAASTTQGAGTFQTPPTFGFNSNAGVTPGFQPSFSGATPSFQPSSSAGATPGQGGFGFGAAAPSFAPTPVPGTGVAQGFSLGSTGGASARRRTSKSRSKRR